MVLLQPIYQGIWKTLLILSWVQDKIRLCNRSRLFHLGHVIQEIWLCLVSVGYRPAIWSPYRWIVAWALRNLEPSPAILRRYYPFEKHLWDCYWVFSRDCNGEGNGNPFQYSCLENTMDRGAWWAAVHVVARSQTLRIDFTFTFTFMHWRRKWQSTPVFLPGESQGWRSLVGCHLWSRTESDTTEAT